MTWENQRKMRIQDDNVSKINHLPFKSITLYDLR